MELLSKIVKNVLTALYETSGFSIILAFLFMFFFHFIKKHGIKGSLKWWGGRFKKSTEFRRVFLLAFYTAMILFRTLLNRNLWLNPLSEVLEGWWIYENGELVTDPIENMMLFIPFTMLLLWAFRDKLLQEKQLKFILWQSVKVTFLFSLSIETLQLFLRLGSFQVSDLVYNTLSGAIGGLFYWICYRVKYKRYT